MSLVKEERMKRIESAQNPTFKEWKKYEDRKYRQKDKKFLVEGLHLVEEAIKANHVESLIVSEEYPLPRFASAVQTYIIPERLVRELAETDTPQGIFAVCRFPYENMKEPQTLLLLKTQLLEHCRQVCLFQFQVAHPTSATFWTRASTHFPLTRL
jgi:tRNA G18 (ribose-2'-O)-methylase SpoU